MSAESRRSVEALVGAGLLIALCCTIAPVVLGALAGSALGGWIGVASAAVVALALLVLRSRARRGSRC
jgi:hypothetical protein